jgi:uncharacterized protein (DUF2147 family)
MKLYLFKLSIIFFVSLQVNPTVKEDQIIGKWENPDKTRHFEIFKRNKLYFGKILWLKNTQNVKVKNGDIVLFDIHFSENKWVGKIKVPAKENFFDLEITMSSIDKLYVKASYGLLSKTKIWTRIP